MARKYKKNPTAMESMSTIAMFGGAAYIAYVLFGKGAKIGGVPVPDLKPYIPEAVDKWLKRIITEVMDNARPPVNINEKAAFETVDSAFRQFTSAGYISRSDAEVFVELYAAYAREESAKGNEIQTLYDFAFINPALAVAKYYQKITVAKRDAAYTVPTFSMLNQMIDNFKNNNIKIIEAYTTKQPRPKF